LISKANDEEKKVEKLGSEGKFNRKTITFTARTDDIIKMKSIGDVGVDDIKSDVAYVKEKEKQAQIVGPLTRRKNDIINYNRTVQELKYTEGPFYDITSIDTHTIRGRRMQNKIWKRVQYLKNLTVGRKVYYAE
jgi:hypothetical protein